MTETNGGSSDTSSPIWRPRILDPSTAEDKEEVDRLIHGSSVWAVHDTIERQVLDLAKARNPQASAPGAAGDALRGEINRVTSGLPLAEYGRWIYYPWSGRLVHVLPPEDYHELRNDRNRNKITAAEQKRLGALALGIVGLSVGNAAALTLTLEGLYGCLKLADFDDLELSNMNRVRAGTHEIGIPKTVITARQIYEVDPYANLLLFVGGITELNMDDFIRGAPTLDILIDECDDIRIKFLLRERARVHGLPVLMETSDRGMMDVERFDQEPARPLFHGLTRDTRAADVGSQLTNEEKVELVVPIIGALELSTRAAASLPEIGQTIFTWPQLASEVALGGATVTTAVRRFGLGEELPSGRRYIDLAALLLSEPGASGTERHEEVAESPEAASLAAGAPDLVKIPEYIRTLVAYAALAPSGGNSQPWHFCYVGDALWVLLDLERSRNLFDQDRRGAYVGIGAAIKNIEIAAARKQMRVEIEEPGQTEDVCGPGLRNVAKLTFVPHTAPASSAEAELFEQLDQRTTNRRPGSRAPVQPEHVALLESVACQYCCKLELIDSTSHMQTLSQILGHGEQVRFLCADLQREMMAELRWTREEAQRTRDGIDIRTLELTEGQATVLRLLRRPEVTEFLRQQNGGARLREVASKAVLSASAVGLISVDGGAPGASLRGGRAIEHLWLLAQKLGYAWHPMTALIYMFEMLATDAAAVFTEHERRTLAALRAQFDEVFPTAPFQSRLMLFRLSVASAASVRSLRRPLSSILSCGRSE